MDPEFVEHLLKKEGAARLVSISYSPAVNKGDNYCSQMTRAELELEMPSGQNIRLSFIIKKKLVSKIQLEFLEEFKIFDREITVYSKIFSQMEKLMAELGDSSWKIWCNFYGEKDGDDIILEDLKVSGFRMADRRAGIDREHGLLAVMSLAKLHAMSAHLHRLGKIPVHKLAVNALTTNAPSVVNYFRGTFDALLTVMRNRWEREWLPVADKIDEVLKNFGEKLQALAKLDEKKLNVVNHGDCWTNNMMFKYEDNHPVEIRLVDFQGSHFNSFAWDLTHFLHSSFLPEVRRELYGELMSAYRRVLVSTLAACGWPEDEAPTASELEAEMRRLQFFGFMLSCSHLPMTLSRPEDALELDVLIDGCSEEKLSHNMRLYTNPVYEKAIKFDIQYFTETGLL